MKNRSFIRENMAWILMGPILVLVGLILCSLYEINVEFQIYLGSIIMITQVIVLGIQYTGFRKQQESMGEKEEENQVPVDEEKWQSIREKEDFFALWAHQIKTPIAALNLLLQSEEKDTIACRNEVFRIEGYVEMALNYLRFEGMSNDLALSGCDLESMVKQVVKKYAPIFIHKHIAVELTNLDYRILTDEKWFCFVLEQTLSNALKYTSKGSVKIYATPDDDTLSITIEDTGIGIRSEDIPRLFEKGFTGYNGRMDKKASGLGLYLCRGIFQKLGHEIGIESKEREGTKVTITVNGEKVYESDLLKG